MEQDLVAVNPDLVAITMNQPFHYGSIPIFYSHLEVCTKKGATEKKMTVSPGQTRPLIVN